MDANQRFRVVRNKSIDEDTGGYIAYGEGIVEYLDEFGEPYYASGVENLDALFELIGEEFFARPTIAVRKDRMAK